jgi:hypothetical protein
MKECISCKENKETNDFGRWVSKGISDHGMVKRFNMCKKCTNSSREGVSADIRDNRRRLQVKSFKVTDPSSNYSKGGFKKVSLNEFDCAIDEMGLGYDEFDDIPGLDD